MRIKLSEIPVFWINLDGQKDRHEKMISLFRRMRNSCHERIPAVRQEPYYLGCNASHERALKRAMEKGRYPFLILEDDVQETPFMEPVLDIPPACRWLYLGISTWNFFPENLQETRVQEVSRIEPFNAQFFRIRNILSTHAIAYCDEESCKRTLNVLKEMYRADWHIDTGFAKLQNDMLCLAPRKGPWFFQDDPKTRWCTSHWPGPGPVTAGQARKRYLRLTEKPHIVLFCRHVGGCGGEEHLMQSMIDALKEVRTTVFVQKSLLTTGMLPVPRENLSIRRFKPQRLLRFLYKNEGNISLFLRISPDPFKGEKTVFRYLCGAPYPKLINPAGNRVDRVIDNYNYILWECDNAASFGMAGNLKNLVVRPPALRPLNQTAPAQSQQAMPAKPFFCTVFNNYQADLKGMDGLSKIAAALPCPLVWCSQRFGPEAPDHPLLVKMTADRGTALSLIRECSAYISLSRSEGFGWSVFEAMMFGKPVFSRPTGIAGEFAEKTFSYDTFEDLAARLSEPLPQRVEYDLSAYSPEAFLRCMYGLIRPDSWRPGRLKDAIRYWKNYAALQLSRIMNTA